MSRRALWWGLVLELGLAAGLLAQLHGRAAPQSPVGWPLAAGVALVLVRALAGRWPRPRLARAGAGAAKVVVLTAKAAAEEVTWRLAVVGALSGPIGPVAAVGAGSVGFALAHVPRQRVRGLRVHVVTGAAFGAVFVVAGLPAAAAAHALYNLLLLSMGPAARATPGATEPG